MTEQVNDEDIEQWLDDARLAERRVPVCLRGDLWAEAERLDRALRDIEKDETDDRFVGNPEAKRLADQIETVRQQMKAATKDFVLRAIPTMEFTQLTANHPPRGGSDEDAASGFNRDTFFRELTRRCVVSPKFDDDKWNKLILRLSDRQWDELTTGAWLVNKGEVSIPFSLAASRILNSGSESKRQND